MGNRCLDSNPCNFHGLNIDCMRLESRRRCFCAVQHWRAIGSLHAERHSRARACAHACRAAAAYTAVNLSELSTFANTADSPPRSAWTQSSRQEAIGVYGAARLKKARVRFRTALAHATGAAGFATARQA